VAVDAAQRLHHVDRDNARSRAANVQWWLDIETMNSWRTLDDGVSRHAQQSDVASVAGEIGALQSIGVESVGIYSTRFQWNEITGGHGVTQGRFAGVPVWLAGYGSKADAIDGCTDTSFTGGPVRMTQYLGSDGFDADVVCGTQAA
jgi:GH25 family lysozyme M1 (1,4-beta-N-acetylmuramidase)